MIYIDTTQLLFMRLLKKADRNNLASLGTITVICAKRFHKQDIYNAMFVIILKAAS